MSLHRRLIVPVVVAAFGLMVISCAALAIKLHKPHARQTPPSVERTIPDWKAPKAASRLATSQEPLQDLPLTWGAIFLVVLTVRILQMRRARA